MTTKNNHDGLLPFPCCANEADHSSWGEIEHEADDVYEGTKRDSEGDSGHFLCKSETEEIIYEFDALKEINLKVTVNEDANDCKSQKEKGESFENVIYELSIFELRKARLTKDCKRLWIFFLFKLLCENYKLGDNYRLYENYKLGENYRSCENYKIGAKINEVIADQDTLSGWMTRSDYRNEADWAGTKTYAMAWLLDLRLNKITVMNRIEPQQQTLNGKWKWFGCCCS